MDNNVMDNIEYKLMQLNTARIIHPRIPEILNKHLFQSYTIEISAFGDIRAGFDIAVEHHFDLTYFNKDLKTIGYMASNKINEGHTYIEILRMSEEKRPPVYNIKVELTITAEDIENITNWKNDYETLKFVEEFIHNNREDIVHYILTKFYSQ